MKRGNERNMAGHLSLRRFLSLVVTFLGADLSIRSVVHQDCTFFRTLPPHFALVRDIDSFFLTEHKPGPRPPWPPTPSLPSRS